MRRAFALLLLVTASASLSANPADGSWKKTTWNGEPVWVSRQDGVEARVSEARSRLIYLGDADREANLLSAPKTLAEATPEDASPNWGGHRFWLGPQARWSWPPLKEWEHAAAASVSVDGAVLRVEHAQADRRYPKLLREYAWEPAGLRCTVRWKDDGRPYYGLQVFAIEAPAVISCRTLAWDGVPHGWVDVQGKATDSAKPVPNAAIAVDSQAARMTSGIARLKAGFYSQDIVVPRGSRTLILSPAVIQGVALASPDSGYLTQIWVGAYEDFSEIEQLTPFLKGDALGWCGSTVWLQVR